MSMLSAPPFPAVDSASLGYYQGTPMTASTSSKPTFTGTFSVTDNGNASTPSCAAASTCPTPLSTATKVFPEVGFVATYATGAQGGTLVEYYSVPSGACAPDVFCQKDVIQLSSGNTSNTYPVMPRVTPDGQYAYVTAQGTNTAAAVDTVLGSVAATITVANTGTFNPTYDEVTPQIFTNTSPFVTYNAWLADPTINNPSMAGIEPIPGAQSPTAVTSPLSPTNFTTAANTNVIASSIDGSRLFVTFSAPEDASNDTFEVFDISAIDTAGSGKGQKMTGALVLGVSANAVITDPRGNVAYVTSEDASGNFNISVITTNTTNDVYAVVNTIPSAGGNICSDNSLAGIAISPDASRLYAVCVTDNDVHVYDVSGADPTANGFGDQVTTIDLTSGPSGYTPCAVAIDPKVNAANTYLFVSCQNSDTISVVTINSDGSYAVKASITTDDPKNPQTCGTGGSCPQVQDMMVNPGIHITTGGDVPPPVVFLTNATQFIPYSTYVVAEGGTVSNAQSSAATRTWSEPTKLLGTVGTACEGLSLNTSTGEISGIPSVEGICGAFVIRVTDASTPPQFVERDFEIVVVP